MAAWQGCEARKFSSASEQAVGNLGGNAQRTRHMFECGASRNALSEEVIRADEGMRMIKRSVEQRADDGYIVDSLGWAYYRLGNMEEAVKQLERAVELKPEDPTINDHLGDAYWRVERMLEARFQWSHARDLKPEPEDLVKIEAKLKSGLRDDTGPAAAPAEHN